MSIYIDSRLPKIDWHTHTDKMSMLHVVVCHLFHSLLGSTFMASWIGRLVFCPGSRAVSLEQSSTMAALWNARSWRHFKSSQHQWAASFTATLNMSHFFPEPSNFRKVPIIVEIQISGNVDLFSGPFLIKIATTKIKTEAFFILNKSHMKTMEHLWIKNVGELFTTGPHWKKLIWTNIEIKYVRFEKNSCVIPNCLEDLVFTN